MGDSLHAGTKQNKKQVVWNGMEWNGVVWTGMQWNGLVWSGMELMEWNEEKKERHACLAAAAAVRAQMRHAYSSSRVNHLYPLRNMRGCLTAHAVRTPDIMYFCAVFHIGTLTLFGTNAMIVVIGTLRMGGDAARMNHSFLGLDQLTSAMLLLNSRHILQNTGKGRLERQVKKSKMLL